YRNRAFNDRAAAAFVAQLSTAEREALVQRMVREEVLYREARRLNLDREDYVIKQRLVQKMEYLTRGFGAVSGDLSEADVAAYYAANGERYREPPGATFTHVFVSNSRGPAGEAQALALLERLNGEGVPFSRATAHGDRFRYHSNYVERSRDFIASHFDTAFTESLFALEPGTGTWQGPIASPHGWHLVQLAITSPGGLPPLAAIRERVAEDARAARLQQTSDKAVAAIVANYRVELPARATTTPTGG